MRQKTPLESTVQKYIEFLIAVRNHALPHDCQFTLKNLVSNYKINKTVIIALHKLDIAKLNKGSKSKWFWMKDEVQPDRQLALTVLNFLLELNKKQIVTPITGLDAETKGYLKAIHDHLINTTPKQNNLTGGLKQGLLSKALNQSQVSAGNHLFSQVESDESKKFELLKAISGGVYEASLKFIMSSADTASIETTNEFIITATEDLFNKFFKK